MSLSGRNLVSSLVLSVQPILWPVKIHVKPFSLFFDGLSIDGDFCARQIEIAVVITAVISAI
jgi:hypothetical protein